MAKANKKQKQKKETKKPVPTASQIKIESKHLDIAFPLLLVVLFVFLMKPMLIDGLTPQGVDVVAWLASSHQTNEFKEKVDRITRLINRGDEEYWDAYKTEKTVAP